MKMGWSVADYRNAPAHVVDNIWTIWALEEIADKARARKREAKQKQRGGKYGK
jgi:hypothetical protein